ncbi:MAG: saccharopine dehydrogenase NADP-binding domain-containing protein [Deltaproteobacteria bacterium]|nr:saccharopine dehydrogenase NADP-binding domain-containing protein [Deltaproteobacteria bacterium]
MKKIAVLGAGFVSKPAVDYFIDRCGYEVIVTSLKKSEAEKIVGGRPAGKSISWTINQLDLLDTLVSEVDLVMSMIPPSLHIPVAQSCLKHRKHMVTTSYISPRMEGLSEQCHARDILILNEIGEDPGLDNMVAKQMIDLVKAEEGEITSLTSYGAGLPAFEHNNNPFGYKFSWSPKGVLLAAQAPAAYLKNGKKVEVVAGDLFDHHWLVDLEGVGTFETYPNRDCTEYLKCFELDADVSFFRGILRFPGWCNTMRGLADLDLLNAADEKNFEGKTYAQFTASLIGEIGEIGKKYSETILSKTASFLNVKANSDLINKMQWLGLFADRKIAIAKGTNADVLVDLMVSKMSYGALEKDMVIVHAEIVAEFPDRREKKVSTMLVKGEPGGDSAMSRAVSLPAAIASKLILEGKIKARGVQRPTLPEMFQPVLKEMGDFGYNFVHNTIKL